MNTASMNHRLVQYSPELEGGEDASNHPPSAVAIRFASDAETFNEGLVMEFAAELLEAGSTPAFDDALRRLILRATPSSSRSPAPGVTQALRGRLLEVALGALPFAGRTLGVPPGDPMPSGSSGPVARPAGQTIAGAARAFGLELEGLSPEDKEFELAKAFVRLTSDAVAQAAAAPGSQRPRDIASRAVARAASRHAPGLLRPALDPRHPLSNHRKEPTMHDIDRTQLEHANEQSEFGENEWSPEGTFSENEEAELATELLSVSNEGELDQFLGALLSRATQAADGFVRSPAGQAVGGVLKGVAKKALPLAGTAIGSYFGGPLGARIGAGVANAAGNALGLESEMASEDRELEGARQFVRIAGQTAAGAAGARPGTDPRAAAQQAALAAAMRHAPGLLGAGAGTPSRPPSPGAGAGAAGGASSGRWLRRGNKIVLYGA